MELIALNVCRGLRRRTNTLTGPPPMRALWRTCERHALPNVSGHCRRNSTPDENRSFEFRTNDTCTSAFPRHESRRTATIFSDNPVPPPNECKPKCHRRGRFKQKPNKKTRPVVDVYAYGFRVPSDDVVPPVYARISYSMFRENVADDFNVTVFHRAVVSHDTNGRKALRGRPLNWSCNRRYGRSTGETAFIGRQRRRTENVTGGGGRTGGQAARLRAVRPP